MLYNRYEFTLRSHIGQLVLEVDPMGSEETETSVGRSEKSFGVFTTVANNLKFIGKAKDFLELNYQVDGVNAEVELTKRMKHLQTDEWFTPKGFPGYLDFTTRAIEENKFTVDFIEGGLKELLETQNREKFEMDRTESISGNPISELIEDELINNGREIFLLSKFEERELSFTTKSGKWRSVNEDRYAFHPLPLKVIANSDQLNISDPIESYGFEDRYDLSTGNMFFSTADRRRGLTKFSGSASFKVEKVSQTNVNEFDMNFVLKRFTSDPDGANLVFIENLFTYPMGAPKEGESFLINLPSMEISPEENDSYAIGLEMVGQYGRNNLFTNFVAEYGLMNITFTDLKTNFTWAEDSFFETTTCKFLTALEVGNRLTEIISGKRKFISNLLSEGDWKDLGFTCGGWIRNLQKEVENTDAQGIVTSTDLKPWSMDFSWDDFYKSIHATQPVGFGIVKKGAKEFLALERIRYFFQPYLTIKLGEVSNLKRSTAKEFVFTSITTGYTKGGDYEEPLGLDEYNIRTTLTSPVIRGGESKYEAISPSRADSYEVERARRKPYRLFPDQDHPSDKDNFLIDAKFKSRSNLKNYYDVRLWADDFEIKPTGVYSPHTAFNLRLSPINDFYRHSPWFNSATVKYKDQSFLHAGSEGNSELQTKPIGKSIRKEHEAVPISELSNPMFEPEWVEFETDASQDLIDMIQGTTMINSEEISNYYGLVEYLAEGKRERGYLFTAKIKNTINWKILKAYGV